MMRPSERSLYVDRPLEKLPSTARWSRRSSEAPTGQHRPSTGRPHLGRIPTPPTNIFTPRNTRPKVGIDLLIKDDEASSLSSLAADENSRMGKLVTSLSACQGARALSLTSDNLREQRSKQAEKQHKKIKHITDDIRSLIAERNSMFNVYIGKSLEDDVYQRDELPRHKHAFYKFRVPFSTRSIKIDIEVRTRKASQPC